MVENLVISIGSIVFVLVGLLTVNKGRKQRAESGRIAELETTAIRDLTTGPIEVKGTANLAEDATLTESPFSKTEAIATHIEIKEWHTGGQGGGNWRTMFQEERAEPIVVDDGTGEVLVDLPTEGGLNLDQSETKIESDDEPPDAIRAYVENHTDLDIPERHSVGPLSVGEPRKYLEGVLEPGEDVYVLGNANETEAGWDQLDYVIDEPTQEGDFVLSNKPEAKLIEEGKQGGFVFLAFGGLLIVVGLGVLIMPWLPF